MIHGIYFKHHKDVDSWFEDKDEQIAVQIFYRAYKAYLHQRARSFYANDIAATKP